MKALVLSEATGPDSVVVRDEPRPALAACSVRVALKAASLNHRELWISRGLYPGMKLPCVMGADGAGVVTEVSDGVDPALVGQEVVLYPGDGWGDNRRFPASTFAMLGMPLPGTVAEEICVPATTVFPKPAHLSFEQAAALPTAGITAWRGLTEKAGLQSGETLLVTGIGGGVATFALVFGRALGATVYVTSGSDQTLARAGELGAAGGFNYREPGWRKALQQACRGLDVVFDGAPAAGLAEYSRALRAGARVVIYGSTGGTAMMMGAPDLFLRHATLMGTAMGDLVDFAAMLAFISTHRLEPVIDRTFTIDEAREALLYLENGHAFGKVVIAI